MGNLSSISLLAALGVVLLLPVCQALDDPEYVLGLGKADITGPVADINLMGYANPSQIAGGIHTRLFARAFIVGEYDDPMKRAVFVNLDACMASQAVTFSVIRRLQMKYGPHLYSEQNVVLSGTHTHSGPAGYLQYLVYDITGLGFVPQTFNALVDGIERAITQAHESMQPAQLSYAEGELLEANINRSPTAYVQNPSKERNMYKFDVDKQMTLLKFAPSNNADTPIGAFTWFPVHGTSMNNTNELVNGDNKGAASQFMEKWAEKEFEYKDSKAGSFIAAFCQANVGDTSPNTQGPFCLDTGEPCDAVHSTCQGRVQQCIGRGPGWPDHFNSTRIIAERQARKAEELLKSRDLHIPISGTIEFRHTFLDMRNITVQESNFTRAGQTCKPAMGFAFAAGTTDGPGAFDFEQSDTNGTAFWRLVRNFIKKPTPEQDKCHAPKPILLDVGEMHFPYEWIPYIVEIQIIRIGQFVILGVPGELTTMSGRRLIKAVEDVIGESWGSTLHIVIAGLSNTYSSYVTTWEEYQVQRYEGGFTLYGPHTLDAYIQEFRKLASAMVEGRGTPAGPKPPDLLNEQWSLVPGVVADAVPFGVNFGDAYKDVAKSVYFPGDKIVVEFHSACPRNDLRAESTFLAVERYYSDHNATWTLLSFLKSLFARGVETSQGNEKGMRSKNDSWTVVHTDNDWETKFYWNRPASLSPYSYAKIVWDIPRNVVPGNYRIRHFGNYKHFLGHVEDFEGSSRSFEVKERQGTRSWSTSWRYILGWRGLF